MITGKFSACISSFLHGCSHIHIDLGESCKTLMKNGARFSTNNEFSAPYSRAIILIREQIKCQNWSSTLSPGFHFLLRDYQLKRWNCPRLRLEGEPPNGLISRIELDQIASKCKFSLPLCVVAREDGIADADFATRSAGTQCAYSHPLQCACEDNTLGDEFHLTFVFKALTRLKWNCPMFEILLKHTDAIDIFCS